jgi:hypothetical protein
MMQSGIQKARGELKLFLKAPSASPGAQGSVGLLPPAKGIRLPMAPLKVAGSFRYIDEDGSGVRCSCHGAHYATADELVKDHKKAARNTGAASATLNPMNPPSDAFAERFVGIVGHPEVAGILQAVAAQV